MYKKFSYVTLPAELAQKTEESQNNWTQVEKILQDMLSDTLPSMSSSMPKGMCNLPEPSQLACMDHPTPATECVRPVAAAHDIAEQASVIKSAACSLRILEKPVELPIVYKTHSAMKQKVSAQTQGLIDLLDHYDRPRS